MFIEYIRVYLLVAWIFQPSADSYKHYQALIPNGALVQSPCAEGTYWPGVGHQDYHGGGDRNLFGKAFANAGHQWSQKLCLEDSDGDGSSNGEELGDPDCIWKPGNKPTRSSNITHPGICEPLDDHRCAGKQNFLKCDSESDSELNCPAIHQPDVKSLKLTLPEKTEVPAKRTTYICYNKKVPSDKLYDIIASKPVIVNTDIMHHMTMYGCDGDLDSSLDGSLDGCELRDSHCEKMLYIWSIGMEGYCQPDYKAFRFGKGLTTWVSIQYHWNNQELRSDMTDASGVEIFYTPKLRPFAEDIFQTGDGAIFIPPDAQEHKVEGFCSEKCSRESIEKPINITGIVLHMHRLGTRMWAKHYRNGKLLRIIAEDNPFHFDRPVFHRFDDSPFELLPGDELKVECTFSAKDKKDWTVFGPGTEDEMCLTLISYVPANLFKVQNCISVGKRCSHATSDFLPGCDLDKLTARVELDQEDMMKYCDVEFGRVCSSVCYSIIYNIKADLPQCFDKQPLDVSRFTWASVIRNALELSHADQIYNAFKGCDLYHQ